ncbi:hypothetical protein BDBG_05382, partial [Blastomyces gilchristii SLH14081]
HITTTPPPATTTYAVADTTATSSSNTWQNIHRKGGKIQNTKEWSRKPRYVCNNRRTQDEGKLTSPGVLWNPGQVKSPLIILLTHSSAQPVWMREGFQGVDVLPPSPTL